MRDPEAHAWAVLDALRLEPAAWGTTPVFLYGFDDLTEVQLDAVRTLSEHVGARVVGLAARSSRGRRSPAGSARGTSSARSPASGVVELPASDWHYAPAARAALHGLERGLFEDAPPRVDPAGAIELLEGGGPRAELELVAERVRRLIDGGADPQQIAHRGARPRRAPRRWWTRCSADAGIAIAHEIWIE